MSDGPRALICAECGALLAADATRCPHCERPVAREPRGAAPGEPSRPTLSPEEREFERRLYRFPKVTATLLAVCVVIWILLEVCGGSEDPTLLILFGAKQRALIFGGEWWRLISASFLHIGWQHLLFNGVALAQLGLFCENIFGRGRFIALYLLTGVGGFLLATSFSDAISAGASASLFGLMGSMLVFGWRHRHEIPPFFQRLFTWMLLPWVILNLGIGGVVANVDNLAHIGGLITGVALAAILGNHIVGEGSDADRSAGLPLGIASLIVMAFVAFQVGSQAVSLLPVAGAIEDAADQGDAPQMVALWGRLIDAEPEVGLFYANRAQAEILTGAYDAAEADLRQALELKHSPSNTLNQLAWLLITRGEVTRQDIDEAARLARRSVAQRRGADNLNTLGWALYLRGDYQPSRTYLEAALELAQRRGMLARAIDAIQRLRGIEPQEVAAFDLYMLAMAQAQLGEEEAARGLLARADVAAQNLRDAFEVVGSPTDRLAALDELQTLSDVAGQAHALIDQAPPPPDRPGTPR